jgi:hypothetical protein
VRLSPIPAGRAAVSYYSIVASGGLGAPAPTLNTQSFAACVLLQVFVAIPSQSILGVPVIQFNGDSGTTSYAYNILSNTLPLGVVTPVGATGIAGAANGIFLAQSGVTGPVVAELMIGNGPSQSHAMMISGAAGVMDASAAPSIISGAGVWSNTAQITSVQLSSSGGGNLGAGTGILVLGLNP